MIQCALANISRHKLSFVVIFILFALLCSYLSIATCVLHTIKHSLRGAVADNLTGDAVIAQAGAKGQIDMLAQSGGTSELHTIENWRRILGFLDTVSYVQKVSPRLRIGGMAKTVHNDIPVVLTGVFPSREQGFFPGRFVDEGRFFKDTNEVGMYYRHSDLLNACIGDSIGLMAQTINGYRNFKAARLAGTFDYRGLSYYLEYARMCVMPVGYLCTLLSSQDIMISEICVFFKHNAGGVRTLRHDMRRESSGALAVYAGHNSAPFIKGIATLTDLSIYLVSIVLTVVVMACVFFIIGMAIELRKNEIAVYRAFGVSCLRIGGLVGIEFFLPAICGCLLGITAGSVLLDQLAQQGIHARIIPLRLIFGRPVLHITVMYVHCIGICIFFAAVSCISLWYTMLKIRKINPLDIFQTA